MLTTRARLLTGVRNVLAERSFSEEQIEKVIPRLHDEHIREPRYLAEIVDQWNILLSSVGSPNQPEDCSKHIIAVAKPPANSIVRAQHNKLDMNTILADVEPDLLLLSPQKLRSRHNRILGLGCVQNSAQNWTILFNAPRGFYLQDWTDLQKKIYYIEHRVIDLLYEKREQQRMDIHPLVKSASVVETEFDHIRTRYLFASRSGYKALSHMFTVQMALDQPTLGDLITSDNKFFLSKFAPFCSTEEYETFADLIKNREFDDDDADVFEKLAELNSLRHDN